jgi:hypothetical protein
MKRAHIDIAVCHISTHIQAKMNVRTMKSESMIAPQSLKDKDIPNIQAYHHSGTILMGLSSCRLGHKRRTLSIIRHQPSVDIGLFFQCSAKMEPNGFPEVQYGVGNGCSNSRERKRI